MVQPFLISNYSEGIDESLQPWLTPNDAFVTLFDGFVHRGVLRPRRGFRRFATGGSKFNTVLDQSKTHRAREESFNLSTSTTFSQTMSNIPLSKRTIIIKDDAGLEIIFDQNGNVTGDINPGGINQVDFETGQIQAEFNAATTDPIIVTYQTLSAQPIMGIFNYIEEDAQRQLIVVDQDVVNIYIPSTNNFSGLPFSTASGITIFTGTDTNFFSSTMYFGRTEENQPIIPRLIMVNNVDPPVFYDDDGKIKGYTNTTDNPDYSGAVEGNIDTALHVFYLGERLLWLNVVLDGVRFPRRILWSGILDNGGNGDKYDVSGAGFLDLSDQGVIKAAILEQNELTIWTSENIYVLSVTADIDEPFRVRRIAASQFRGSNAPYSAVNWFGQAAAIGRTGIVASDGRQASRVDNKIPRFTERQVVQDKFNLIYGGQTFEDSQYWWAYPDQLDLSDEQLQTSTRILVRNFEEGNWSIFRFPINCMGYFKEVDKLIWDDVYEANNPTWEEWDTTEDIWDSFSSSGDEFITLVGDANGVIYRMIEDSNDQTITITNISNEDGAMLTISGQKLKNNDTILIGGVDGIEVDGESIINNREFTVSHVDGNNVRINLNSSEATPYIEGGWIVKGYEFLAKTKPLNPFVEQGMKARLVKIDFFVDADNGEFLIDLFMDDNGQPYKSNLLLNTTAILPGQEKVWKTIGVNQTANFHSLQVRQKDTNVNGRIHAFRFWFEPTGRMTR